MDRLFNSNSLKEKIYAIYKGCRLCGAGGGFKMPIIQNVVDLDENGVELRQKIKECVQIEVKLNDKMPPLICELCIDKINDFYEFLELCQQTNKRTRMQLGLPLQQQETKSDNCILGHTERVIIKDEEDEPLSKQKVKVKEERRVTKEPEKKGGKDTERKGGKDTERKGGKDMERKGGKETDRKGKVVDKKVAKPDVRVNKELEALKASLPIRERDAIASNSSASRSSRGTKRPASPSPSSARSSRSKAEEKQDTPSPIKKNKDVKKKEPSLVPQKKRVRESDPPKPEVPAKKVKLQPAPPKSAKPAPKCKEKPKTASPPPTHCAICSVSFKSLQSLSNHNRWHLVTYTDNKLACNACGSWFVSEEEAAAHHRRHKKTYECAKCYQTYPTNLAFDVHQKSSCISDIVSPEVQCVECWRFFITDTLRSQHKCLGVAARPVKCKNCDRLYQLKKSLQRHESTCSVRKKDGVKVQADVLNRLMPLQIRVAKCDPLLQDNHDGHCDVSAIGDKCGLDPTCVYPYKQVRIKSEPINAYDEMVHINDELHQQYLSEKHFVHWDEVSSDEDSDSSKTVNNLSTICLKTLFSNKCLGKVPRKLRKIKPESVFDSLFSDSNVTKDINRIISGLNANDDSNDSVLGGNTTTDFNADFDSLLNNDEASNNSEEQSILKGFIGGVVAAEDNEKTRNVDENHTNVHHEKSDVEHNEKESNVTEIETVMDRNDNADTKSDSTSIGDNNVETHESICKNFDTKSDNTSMGDTDSQQSESEIASKCDRILSEQQSERAMNTEEPDKGDATVSESANTDIIIGTSSDRNETVNESACINSDTNIDSTSFNENDSGLKESQNINKETDTPIRIDTQLDYTMTENEAIENDSESVNADTECDSKTVSSNEGTKLDITDTCENLIQSKQINTEMENKNTAEDENLANFENNDDDDKCEQVSNNIHDSFVSEETTEPTEEIKNSNLVTDENVNNESENANRSEMKTETTEVQKSDQNNDEQNTFNCRITPDHDMSNENSNSSTNKITPDKDMSNDNSNSVCSENIKDASENKDSLKNCDSELDVSNNTVSCRLGNTVDINVEEQRNDMETNVSNNAKNIQENVNVAKDLTSKLNLEVNGENLEGNKQDLTEITEDNTTVSVNENSRINGNEKSSDTEDIDDDKLMDEINKQIGESKENSEHDSKNSSGEKITLEDLIQMEKPSDKSLELDNISDEEFNFDS